MELQFYVQLYRLHMHNEISEATKGYFAVLRLFCSIYVAQVSMCYTHLHTSNITHKFRSKFTRSKKEINIKPKRSKFGWKGVIIQTATRAFILLIFGALTTHIEMFLNRAWARFKLKFALNISNVFKYHWTIFQLLSLIILRYLYLGNLYSVLNLYVKQYQSCNTKKF